MSAPGAGRRRPGLNLVRLVRSGPPGVPGPSAGLDLLRLDKIEEARARVRTGFYARPEVRRAVAEILSEMLRDRA